MDTKETTNMNTNIKKEVSESKTNESETSPYYQQIPYTLRDEVAKMIK